MKKFKYEPVFPPECTHEDHKMFKYCPYTPMERLERLFNDIYNYGGTGIAGSRMVAQIIDDTVEAELERRAGRINELLKTVESTTPKPTTGKKGEIA